MVESQKGLKKVTIKKVMETGKSQKNLRTGIQFDQKPENTTLEQRKTRKIVKTLQKTEN